MKIGFLITARLKSSRLKHKILLDLNGKSIIQHIIDRCKATPGIDEVVLCTSVNPQDSILYDFAQKSAIKFWAGSEQDVLDRLCSAAEYYHLDGFLSITADNPLFSIYTSQLLIDWVKKESFDFAFTKGLPIGMATAYLNVKALKIANFMRQESDTEIWGPFVNQSDFFHIGLLNVANSPFGYDRRITCDYPEDYQFFRKLYDLNNKKAIPRIWDIFETLNEHPDLWEIHKEHVQRMPSEEELERINTCFDNSKEKGLHFAGSISHKLISGLKEKDAYI